MSKVKELQMDAFDLIDALWEEDTESIIEKLKSALGISTGTAIQLYEDYCDSLAKIDNEPDISDEEAFASAGWGTDESYGGQDYL